MRKKIAILTYSLIGGGAERAVANLLQNLDRSKYDIHLVLMSTDIDYEIPADQIIHFISKSDNLEREIIKLIKLPMLAKRFSKYCNDQNIELVFSLMNRPNMVATMARYFGLKAKVLISERFYTPYYYNNDSLGGRIKTWLLKKYYKKADCILPNSQATRRALENIFGIKTDYRVIKNPANISAIRSLRNAPITEGIKFDKFTFIYVSAFRPEKNHSLLIEAVADLKEKDFQLILIGKGELQAAMIEKVQRLALQKKVIFLPFTENPFKFLSKSTCFVSCSPAEGSPNVLIESLICELPIIAPDCKTGQTELLDPRGDLTKFLSDDEIKIAQNGILYRNNSKQSLIMAMNWAMEHPEELNEFKEKGLVKSADFDLPKVVNDISSIFDEYLEKPNH